MRGHPWPAARMSPGSGGGGERREGQSSAGVWVRVEAFSSILSLINQDLEADPNLPQLSDNAVSDPPDSFQSLLRDLRGQETFDSPSRSAIATGISSTP